MGVLTPALDLFSSVWFGIGLLAFLFVYMSVGSAAYQVRQMRWFEMTEFEWFHWWPFDVAVGLLCVTLTVTTVRRIRLNVVNLGVWMIHTGIVVLCVGSVVYFKMKVEGDTPVFRRQVIIDAPGHGRIDLVALPGARAEVGRGPTQRVYEVVETRPDWPILSGEHEGKRVFSVSVKVTAPEGEFVRQLLDGFPQYTEDVIPGKGRAVKTTGKRLVDETLAMSLGPMPQEWFYLVNTWALYAREVGPSGPGGPTGHGWAQRPIRGLPRYNDYVSSVDDVFPAAPSADDPLLRPSPLSIETRTTSDATHDPLAGARVRVTGYLRYAVMDTRLIPTNQTEGEPNPALFVRLSVAGGETRTYQLAALDPEHSSAEGGQLVFRWAESEADVEAMATPAEGRLSIAVGLPGGGRATAEARVERPAAGTEAAFVPIEGAAGWSYRIREVIDNLPMSDGRVMSLAIVDVRTPEKSFTRWVADNPAATRDFDESGSAESLRAPDASVTMTYRAARAAPRLAFAAVRDASAAGGARLEALVGKSDGTAERRAVRLGESFRIGEGLSAEALHFAPYARHETRPAIVPASQRDKDAGTAFAMARVEVTADGATESKWIPFNQYVFDDTSFMYHGRFRRDAAEFSLPGGRRVEVIFGRERMPLPAPVQLDDFRLVSHVGGFTGEMASIRDWESVLRFVQPPKREGEPYQFTYAMTVRVNEPVEFAGMRFFQAMWDPPQAPRFEGDVSTAGLNFTGLGVGNRRGVMTQLAGCTLMVAGMLYAFYVKPEVKRRRRERALREAAAGRFGEEAARRARAATSGIALEESSAPAGAAGVGAGGRYGAGAMDGTVEATP